MSNLKISNKAMRAIRQLPEVRAELERRAELVAEQASENGRVSGYVVTDLVLEVPRGASSVMATGHARNHNRKTLALVKALEAARD